MRKSTICPNCGSKNIIYAGTKANPLAAIAGTTSQIQQVYRHPDETLGPGELPLILKEPYIHEDIIDVAAALCEDMGLCTAEDYMGDFAARSAQAIVSVTCGLSGGGTACAPIGQATYRIVKDNFNQLSYFMYEYSPWGPGTEMITPGRTIPYL